MKSYTYLLIDLGCISIPFIASFYPKYPFYKQWKHFLPANFLVGFLFLVWDYIFTEKGVWGFNPDYLTGLYIGNLPIEEVLFFLCIPYATTFTYFSLTYLVKNNPLAAYERQITIGFLGLVSVLMIAFWGHLYTMFTCLFTACFLGYCLYTRLNMAQIYLGYILILPFFFASNGLLTGSFLDSPIVWYNDAENIGLRMFTIPVEDSIYGFLMVALNIHLSFKNAPLKAPQFA